MLLAIDLEKHFVTVPLVARLRTPPTQLLGELLAKFATPLAHRFVGDDHAPCSQELFDITIAEVEAMIEPNRMSDNFLGKPKTFVGWSNGVCFHAETMIHVTVG